MRAPWAEIARAKSQLGNIETRLRVLTELRNFAVADYAEDGTLVSYRIEIHEVRLEYRRVLRQIARLHLEIAGLS